MTPLPPYLPADAVPTSALWPDLPARLPPVPVSPAPAPALIRQQRLDREQGAT